MGDVETIAAAQAAWKAIQGQSRATFADWIKVARALALGRAECMAQAKANSPAGSRYNRLAGIWLEKNGFADISPQERYRSLWVLERLPEIEQWLASLPPEISRRFNHPGAIAAGWKRAQAGLVPCKPGPRPAVKHAAPDAMPARTAHPYATGFHADDLRLGAKALSECLRHGNIDLYATVRKIFEAAGVISSRVAPTTRSNAAMMPADALHAPEHR
jgi:hypothetical protein